MGKEVEKMWRINALHRYGVRPSGSRSPYTCSEIMLDVDKEFGTDTKSLWGKILDLLPTYAIFKADRESSDGDSEAKNPLQQAVKTLRLRCRTKLQRWKMRFRTASWMSHRERWINYVKCSPELASELTPRFKEKPKWTFNFTLDGENGIPINKRGSGIRRLILLNFFGLRLKRMSRGRPEM